MAKARKTETKTADASPKPRALAFLREHEVADVAIAALPGLLCVLPLLDFVPVWDGRIYADCIRNAALSPSMSAFRCGGHPSLVFAAVLSFFAMPNPDSPVFIALGSVALFLVSLFAFHVVARRLAPGPERRLEALLLTAAFGLLPQLLAGIVHTTPDLGVAAFWLLAIAALTSERPVLATIFGTAAALSKENGLLVFALSTLTWAVVYVTRAPLDGPTKLRRFLAHWHFLVPLAAYFLAEHFKPVDEMENKAIEYSERQASLLRQFLSLSNLDNYWPAALASTLVMNFAWVATAAILVRAGKRTWQFLLGQKVEGKRTREDTFVLVLFVVVLWGLTRFRTYLNLRYFLPVMPLLLLVAWRCLGDRLERRTLRLAAIGGFCVLELVSVYRTVDPLAKEIFGTFAVGERELLHMTSLTQECCGRGRDQLAYNLEFTHLGTLAELSYQGLAPTQLPIAVDTLADWFTYGALDPQTLERQLKPGVKAQLVTLGAAARSKQFPNEMWFVQHPNFPNDELNQWLRFYESLETRSFSDGAYSISAQHLRRR